MHGPKAHVGFAYARQGDQGMLNTLLHTKEASWPHAAHAMHRLRSQFLVCFLRLESAGRFRDTQALKVFDIIANLLTAGATVVDVLQPVSCRASTRPSSC